MLRHAFVLHSDPYYSEGLNNRASIRVVVATEDHTRHLPCFDDR